MTKFDSSFKRIDPVDEVIDILDQIGQDDFTVYTGDTGAQSAASPQVIVQQTDKLPMSPEEQQAQAFRNLYGDGKSLGMYTGDTGFQKQIDFDAYNALSPSPEDNLSGFQQASAASPQVKSLTPTYQGSNVPIGSLETDRNKIINDALFQNELRRALGMLPSPTSGTVDLGGGDKAPSTILNAFAGSDPGLAIKYQQAGKIPVQGAGPFSLQSLGLRREGDSLRPYSPKGIAGPYEAMDPDMFDQDTGDYINFLDRIDQQRALNAGQGIASVAPYTGMEQMLARQAQAGQGEAYKDFFFDEASRDPSIFDPLQAFVQKAFGYPEGMRGLYEMEQNKKAAMARNKELEEDSRKDREDRERAAMLAAQQQQPVDPCPEGYRMDPVSKVCVPVDDTIDTDPVKRTYDTMTRPEPNYTAATGFTLPAITLPDILTGN
jgi:hypothetical protein